MIESTGTWADVRLTDPAGTPRHWPLYVRSPHRGVWKAVADHGDRIVLENAEGTRATIDRPADDIPVQILVPSDEEYAVKLVRDELGAMVIASRDADDDWVGPNFSAPGAVESVAYHLDVMHGVFSAGMKDDLDRLDLHRQIHRNRTHFTVRHTHNHYGRTANA